MNIQIWHSQDIDYKNTIYLPIKHSELYTYHTFIFPHDGISIDSRESLKEVDVFIAEVSTPSTGLGIELWFASIYQKEIICIYKLGAKPSGSLKYITKNFIEYSDSEDLITKISTFISNK